MNTAKLKEALANVDQPWLVNEEWEIEILAAARAYLASQEQTPDYGAARVEVLKLIEAMQAGSVVSSIAFAHSIVDAALVGFHPQPTEGDER